MERITNTCQEREFILVCKSAAYVHAVCPCGVLLRLFVVVLRTLGHVVKERSSFFHTIQHCDVHLTNISQ